jgi:hypothetical protein
VVLAYEAGPLGCTHYRRLKAAGYFATSVPSDSAEQQRKRRKNNKIDARNLNQQAVQLPQWGSRRVTISARAGLRKNSN